MFSYQEKYLKYKNKYLKLKDLIGGENKFKCIKENRIIGNLCIEDETGQFNDIVNCEINCLEEKLNEEFSAWRQLFAWSLKTFRDIHIYCKGGSALGLQVLKTILDKDRSKYNDFIDLKLIKDWDFTVNMSVEQQVQFIAKAKELGIDNQGQELAILRFKKGLLLGEDYLLELSIKTTQELYDLELPLTNLKFIVDSSNIELFFEIVKMYVKKEINLDIMSQNLNSLLTTITVNNVDQVVPIQNGLYTITDLKQISTANLNQQLLEIMDQIPDNLSDRINKLTMKQFLITHICQPDRLLLRFLGKNIIKSQKITRFYHDNKIELPEWLIDETVLEEINKKIMLFLNLLNEYIESQIVISDETLLDKPKDLLKPFLALMNILFENVNLARIEITESNKMLVKCLVPWSFFQKVKQNSLRMKQEKDKELELSGKLDAATLALRRQTPIKIKYIDYIPSDKLLNNTKYMQFIRYIIDRIE